MEKNNMYELIRVLERTNKEGKNYFLAILCYHTDRSSDLIQVLITPEQAEKLKKVDLNTQRYDMSKHITIEYNTYSKAYQPKITI